MSTRLPTVRASSLPLGFRCPASLRPEGLLVNVSNDAAADGTAAHECLQDLAERGFVDWDAVADTASRHGADVEQVRILCAQANRLWGQEISPGVRLRDYFAEAISEVTLQVDVAEDVTLTGHVDLLAFPGPKVAHFGDWKTGRKDGDYSHQMRAYGAMILADNPDLDVAIGVVIWVREQEVEIYRVTRDSARAWRSSLLETVVDWDGVYRPGQHCGHCNRSHECKAGQALVARDVAVIADPAIVARTEGAIEAMTPQEIIDVLQKADLVVKYAERIRAAIKDYVHKNGPVSDGLTTLDIATENRRELDPEKAWPVLEAAGFTDQDFASAMKLSVSQVEKVVAKKAGRGKGAGAVRELQKALTDAGAITTEERHKLQAKRA